MRNYHYHTEGDDLYIFLEYAGGGTLTGKIKKLREENKIMNENQVKIYTKQILEGLEYLHCVKGVFHRDIKPENVLLTLSENIKISDFGESKFVNLSGGTRIGTPPYMAPEIVLVRWSFLRVIAAGRQSFNNSAKRPRTSTISSSTFGPWGAWFSRCSPENCSTGSGLSICKSKPVTSVSSKKSNLFNQALIHDKIQKTRISREAKDFLIDCIQIEPSNRKNVYELLRSE